METIFCHLVECYKNLKKVVAYFRVSVENMNTQLKVFSNFEATDIAERNEKNITYYEVIKEF